MFAATTTTTAATLPAASAISTATVSAAATTAATRSTGLLRERRHYFQCVSQGLDLDTSGRCTALRKNPSAAAAPTMAIVVACSVVLPSFISASTLLVRRTSQNPFKQRRPSRRVFCRVRIPSASNPGEHTFRYPLRHQRGQAVPHLQRVFRNSLKSCWVAVKELNLSYLLGNPMSYNIYIPYMDS